MGLAEERRRQKWSLNPRGTLWANDDNKFGQKLMEKMGWSKGKGLGKEEQGEKDCVAVKIKENTKGLGYKGKDDEWIKHYEGYENVLATLNNENNSAATSPCNSTPNSNVNSEDEDSKRFSLEAHSKKSQARVHYHKFMRGKDLSRCDPDVIACITGSKRAKLLADVAKKEEAEDIGNVNHSSGLTTIKAGNIQDYFAMKMAKLKGQLNQLPNAEGVDAPSKSDVLGDGCLQDDHEREDAERSRGKKKRKNVEGDDAEMQEIEEYGNLECEGKPKKKKKSKKNRMVVDDSTLDSDDTKEEKRRNGKARDNENCVGDCDVEEPQKKKKKKVVVVDALENNEADGENCFVKERHKKKKKRRSEDVHGKEGDTELLESEKATEEVYEKKKKKKKHVEENGDNETPSVCNAEEPKSKKKKKSKNIEEII